MSKRVRKFEWNGVGLKPIDAPKFDYGKDVHFAHDMVEHLTNGDDFRSELLAAGATAYGRGFVDRYQLDIRGEDMCNFIAQENYQIPPIAQRWYKPLKSGQGEHAIERIARVALDNTPYYSKRNNDFGKHWIVEHSKMLAVMEDFKAWMRLGYMHAKRFYRGVPQDQIFYLFDEMYHGINSLYRKGFKPGQIIEASFDTVTREVSIK